MKQGRAALLTLLAAAALAAYTFAELQAAGVETERRAAARDALTAEVQRLTEANDELAAALRAARSDPERMLEALARERLGPVDCESTNRQNTNTGG